MNPELVKALQDCIITVNKLLTLLEDDVEDMPNCVNGEILAAYKNSADEARNIADTIKKSLLLLRDNQ